MAVNARKRCSCSSSYRSAAARYWRKYRCLRTNSLRCTADGNAVRIHSAQAGSMPLRAAARCAPNSSRDGEPAWTSGQAAPHQSSRFRTCVHSPARPHLERRVGSWSHSSAAKGAVRGCGPSNPPPLPVMDCAHCRGSCPPTPLPQQTAASAGRAPACSEPPLELAEPLPKQVV